MSQLNVDTLRDRTGADQPDIVGAAKAFVNFNGTGTVAIRDDFNVDSITDGGTGSYTVNFTAAFSDTNYALVAMATVNTTGTTADYLASEFTTNRATSSAQIIVRQIGGAGATNPVDTSYCQASVHSN